ncbi:uncharacterized protein V6R79_014713 [Siganus canaliculatus]
MEKGKNFPCFSELVHPSPPPSGPYRPKPSFLDSRLQRSEVRQTTCIYSEEFAPFKFKSCAAAPEFHTIPQSIDDLNTAKAAFFEIEEPVEKSEDGSTVWPSENSYFRPGGDTPKLQLAFQTVPGNVPRLLALERLRREYSKLDLEQLLAKKGICSNLLMPRQRSSSDPDTEDPERPEESVSPYIPLEIFDNNDYDSRTPEDWLTLGCTEETAERKPIPAKALLPVDDLLASAEDPKSPSLEYSWHLVGVLDYCKEKCQYLVEKVLQRYEPSSDGGNSPKKHKKDKCPVITMVAGTKYWVPRIRLLFRAEDPRVFVERIQFAKQLRERAEALIFYQLSVDCMPTWKGTPSLNTECIQRVKKKALSVSGLSQDIAEKCSEALEKQIKLQYSQTMNSIMFDAVATCSPELHSYITVPTKELPFPHQGFGAVPSFDSHKSRQAFFGHSLLTRPEVISALADIQSECYKIASMRLFKACPPLPLADFVKTQSNVQAEIRYIVENEWIEKLSGSIQSNVGQIGKGDYKLTESRWDIFKLSKMYRLMTRVRINMQDSLRSLVKDSLVGLTQLLLDSCHSLLTCPQDLVWGKDLIVSPYMPKSQPLFQLDLVLDEAGVRYSPPLDVVATSFIDLFDQSILITHNIPQLIKFVMRKLLLPSTALLEPIFLCDPEMTHLREKVRHTLAQAAIPLRAYAAACEKHDLDVETILKAHIDAEKTSKEVKREVKKLVREKEKLRSSLPSAIVIGPVLVQVRLVRETLCGKRQRLANAMLGSLTKRIRNQLDDVCEECKMISTKLSKKPNSMEELNEMREWMKQIPEEMKSYKVHSEDVTRPALF